MAHAESIGFGAIAERGAELILAPAPELLARIDGVAPSEP